MCKKEIQGADTIRSIQPSLSMIGHVCKACIRRCLLYWCKTLALRVELELRMERTEMRMIRWMCGVSMKEWQPITEPRGRLRVQAIGNVMRRCRLRCHGHAERKGDADRVKACAGFVVEGTALGGMPKKIWQNTVSVDMCLLKNDPRDVHDRMNEMIVI